MRGAFLIAAREITERRAALLAALVAGLVPFTVPFLPGIRAEQGADARDGVALVLGVAFGVGIALVLGATIVGRDLSEGRLGFDFARPLPGRSIWAGRLLGAVALTLLVLLVVVLPTTLVGGGLLSKSVPGMNIVVLATIAAVFFLVPLSHFVSIAFRSRSAWLGVDLVGLILVALIGTLAGRRLSDGFAVRNLVAALAVLVVVAFPALWAATYAQVAGGRTDARRGHRLQSTVLWGCLLVAVACFDVYSRFVVHAGPEDILTASALPAPQGDWLVVVGNARGRGDFLPSFLLNSKTGRALPLGGADPWIAQPVVFSGDGEHAVWLRPGGLKDPRHDVLSIDLSRPDDGFKDTRVSFPGPFVQVALSEDGARLAALEGASLAVYRTADGALLASARCQEAEDPPATSKRGWLPRPVLFFADADHVRAILVRTSIEIHELDVAAKKIVKTGAAPTGLGFNWMTRDAAGHRLLLRDGHGKSDASVLLDGRSAAVLATFPPEADLQRSGFRFLADGRLVFVERRAGTAVLRSFTPAGEERLYPVDAQGVVAVGGEIAPGRLVLGSAGRIFVLDLVAGDLSEKASGNLSPWVALPWARSVSPAAPGSIATRLFQSGGAVVVLDPATGAERVLVGRKGA